MLLAPFAGLRVVHHIYIYINLQNKTQGKKGAIIGDRFEVHADVGLGTFGRVVECWDLKRRRRVAVKVVRKVSKEDIVQTIPYCTPTLRHRFCYQVLFCFSTIAIPLLVSSVTVMVAKLMYD